MLTVAFDVGPTLDADPTGVAVVARSLFGELRPHVQLVPYEISLRRRRTLQLVHPAAPQLARPWRGRVPASVALRLWSRNSWPGVSHWVGTGVDVVHGTNFIVPPLGRGIGGVVTVHDLAWLHGPGCESQLVDPLFHLHRANRMGAVFHAVSHAVADDLAALFPRCSRIIVAHPGPPPVEPADDPDANRTGRPFLVAVGTLEPRKNYIVLIEAFALIAQNHPELELRIIGSQNTPHAPEVLEAARRCEFGARIHFEGYLSESQKLRMIEGAAALVYPSLYEGFGFPLLEAMAVGTPSVAARVGGIPEAAGDGALLVETPTSAAFAEAVLTLLSEDSVRARQVLDGHAHVAQMSWQGCRDGLLGAYEQAVGR